VRLFGQNLNINVLAVEYPGFGLNFKRGITTMNEIKLEAKKVLQFVKKDLNIQNSEIILFGRSMGTGVAVYLATLMQENPPNSLILASPYLSIREVGASKMPNFCKFLTRCLIGKHFNLRKMVKSVTCPTLVIHGAKDTMIPLCHAQELV
jgi:pimeloyl-ACP methyl ester carboxylesterase